MKRGVAMDITFINSCRLPLTILFIYNNNGCLFNHEETMCKKYKIIVAIMNYINCYIFLFIKLRMYILKYIDFVVKML